MAILTNPRYEIVDRRIRKHSVLISAQKKEQMETLLKKPEVKRDAEGRFERAWTEGQTIKKRGNTKKPSQVISTGPGTIKGRGPGRPKGSKNRIPQALKEMILESLDEVGGKAYLAKLAIENSSAYASLLGKVLPSTLDASERSGGPTTIRFERVIVMPDGRRHIEGVTPKQLPAPASHELPNSTDLAAGASDINKLED